MPKKVRKKIKYQAGVLERRKEGKKSYRKSYGGKGCRTGVYRQSMGCTGVLDCKELQKGFGETNVRVEVRTLDCSFERNGVQLLGNFSVVEAILLNHYRKL